jgi:cytochrome P450
MLAKNQDKQDKLRAEVMTILPEKSTVITKEKMNNMPYMRACIKEMFRTMPVGIGNLRTVQSDTELAGYHIPKDTNVAMVFYKDLVNPNFYPQPYKYMPERWLREKEDIGCPRASENNTFTLLPFGHGSR